jgi:hypothetical protein
MNTGLIMVVNVVDGYNNNNNNNNNNMIMVKYAGKTAQGHLQNKHEYIDSQIQNLFTKN